MTWTRFSARTTLTLLGSTPVAATGGVGAVDARLSPDGRFLYVDESRIGKVGAFAVNGGNLTELGTSPFALRPALRPRASSSANSRQTDRSRGQVPPRLRPIPLQPDGAQHVGASHRRDAVICLSCVAGVEQAPDEEAHRGGAEPLATIFRQSPTRVTDEQTPAPNSTPALSTNAVISAAARGSYTNGNSGIKWPTRMATVIMTAPRKMSAVCTGCRCSSSPIIVARLCTIFLFRHVYGCFS